MLLLAGAFAAPAQLDEGRVYFSLAAEQTVLPGRAAPVRVQAQGVRQLEFRLYRVREPRAFFLKLDNASSFGTARPRRQGARTPIEKFAAWKSRQRAKIRNFFRMQFSPENRAILRAWLQKRTKKPKTPAEAAPEYAGVPVLNPQQLVKRWTQPLPAGRPWETATVEAPLAEAGVYVLEATDQQRQAYTVLIATPLAVLAKSAAGTVMARVTDRISGAPRAGCAVEVLDPLSKQSVAKETSDGNGAVKFSIRGQFEDNLVLLADCGGVPAAVQLAAFSLAPRWRGTQGALHTDRPVYRPGQTVHFRAIVREERGSDYALPEARRARVTVEDPAGTRIYQKTLSFTKYGTVRGEFRLEEDAPLGYYGIRVAPEESEEGVYGGFHVEEYRKPEYEVKVTPGAARTLQGGRAKAQIQARYFFGEPVAGAATAEIPIRPEYTPNVFVKAVFVLNDKLYTGEKILKVPPAEKQIFVELTPSKKLFQPGEDAEFRLAARDNEGRPLQAEFALGVVDEAIYAIRREAQPDLVKIFYGRRWNRVNTSTSQSYYFYGEAGTRRMELARQAGPPWRAQLKREDIAEPKIRKDFPDTAFWVADLETDAQGRAQVRFAFPDSLTTWRATARGVTVDTKAGGAVARVLVRKDVIVSMAAPRFFTEGDEAVVPVLVRNYTGQPQQARVSLRAQGVRIVSGEDTDVEAPPQGEARVDYRLKAEAEGVAVLTASARSRGGSDAMEIRLPVHAYGVPMSAAAQERIDGGGRRVLAFDFPPEAGGSGRTVEVRLSPSLAGSLFGALEYLVTYPYGCTEQVMSGFLPNLVVAEALRKLKLETQVDRKELDRNVKAGLEKLAGYQNGDGSWGWWSGDEGDVFLTSYVLLGLSHARENGYAVPQWRRDQATQWLGEQLRRREVDADAHAYALLALAMDRKPGEDVLAAAWGRRRELSGFGWAALGLALQKAGDARRREAAAALALMAQEEGEGLYWPSRRDPMLGREAEHTFEATAMAVRFLAAESPESPQVERAVRWLLAHRDRGYYWGSTKRTAFVVYGLTPLLERSGQLKPDFTARVLADGREVLRRRFSAEDALAAKPVRAEAPAARRHSEVRVEMEGRGTLYVSANWKWRLAEPGEARVRPENSPLRIERRYWRLRAVQAGGRVDYELEPWSGAARRGELVAVHLRVTGANLMNALVVEDPVPAGAEAVGRSDGLALRGVPKWWQWWHARRELRDNRVLWFPWRVPQSGFDAVYLFRFTTAGRFRVSPARVEPMYEPGVMAWSEAAEWEVLP